jgi:hypothetical protein
MHKYIIFVLLMIFLFVLSGSDIKTTFSDKLKANTVVLPPSKINNNVTPLTKSKKIWRY